MSTIDIDELHHETAAILHRVREQSETIAISQNGEIVAHLNPEPPVQAEWTTGDQ